MGPELPFLPARWRRLTRAEKAAAGYPIHSRVTVPQPAYTIPYEAWTTKQKQRVRRLLAARQGWICVWCGCTLDENAPIHNDRQATIEHVVPRCKGGSDDLTNLALACRRCNLEDRGQALDLQPRSSRPAPIRMPFPKAKPTAAEAALGF